MKGRGPPIISVIKKFMVGLHPFFHNNAEKRLESLKDIQKNSYFQTIPLTPRGRVSTPFPHPSDLKKNIVEVLLYNFLN